MVILKYFHFYISEKKGKEQYIIALKKRRINHKYSTAITILCNVKVSKDRQCRSKTTPTHTFTCITKDQSLKAVIPLLSQIRLCAGNQNEVLW